jgi:hypothetical protein
MSPLEERALRRLRVFYIDLAFDCFGDAEDIDKLLDELQEAEPDE